MKVFTETTIFGDIHRGNSVIIGAGAIVDIDIPDNRVVKAGQSVVIIPK